MGCEAQEGGKTPIEQDSRSQADVGSGEDETFAIGQGTMGSAKEGGEGYLDTLFLAFRVSFAARDIVPLVPT